MYLFSCNAFKIVRNKKTMFLAMKRNLTAHALIYKEYGDPEKVLKLEEMQIADELKPNQVVVKILAAPINPADINMVQGKYALLPPLPAVGGNEGLAEVIKVGSSVSTLNIGDRVIPASAGSGTWRTHAISEENDFTPISKSLPLVSAATISVNPCTAYRMLHDFVELKPGDTVIQNGSNSGVGQAVIQIAKQMNVNTINVIRDRPNLEEFKSHMISLGATYVVLDTELRTPCMADIFKKIPKASLALNCVGGKSAAELTRHMINKSIMVTYGGMSKQPLTISTASLIFNDIQYRGFWMTRWSKENSVESRKAMLQEISSIIEKDLLKPPASREVPFTDFKSAISKSMEPFVSQKQILVMN